jgi:hypothetical protein
MTIMGEAFHVSFKCGHAVWFKFPNHAPIKDYSNIMVKMRGFISGMKLFDCPWCGGETRRVFPPENTILKFDIHDVSVHLKQYLSSDEVGYHSFCVCDEPSSATYPKPDKVFGTTTHMPADSWLVEAGPIGHGLAVSIHQNKKTAYRAMGDYIKDSKMLTEINFNCLIRGYTTKDTKTTLHVISAREVTKIREQ